MRRSWTAKERGFAVATDAVARDVRPTRQRCVRSLPVAVTVFPGEIYRAPKSWTQRAYRDLVYFNKVDKSGLFAVWEQPQLDRKRKE